MQDAALDRRKDIEKHERLLLALLGRYSDPERSPTLRRLLPGGGAGAGVAGLGGGAGSAEVPPAHAHGMLLVRNLTGCWCAQMSIGDLRPKALNLENGQCVPLPSAPAL